MQWPTMEEVSAMTPLPEGYRFERMKRADIGPRIGEQSWPYWRWNSEKRWGAPWARGLSTHWPP